MVSVRADSGTGATGDRMAEILWHRRVTRRQTENTNFCLNGGKATAYSPTTVLRKRRNSQACA
jgi:hypothetical protein